MIPTSCCLVNLSPSLSLGQKKIREVWSQNNPTISHLRSFHYADYMNVPKESGKMMNSNMFIGYGDLAGIKGYMVWIIYEHMSTYS